MRSLRWVGPTYVGMVYLMLYLPILVLVLYSFNDATYTVQWRGFTWQWYVEVFKDALLWRSLFCSLWLGVISASLATLLSLIWVVINFGEHSKWKQSINSLLILLVVMPDIVFAVGLIVFFHGAGIHLGFYTLLCAHTTMALPISGMVLRQRLDALDPQILEASIDLGASHWYTIRTVLFPILFSAIISAWLLSFTLSFDDFLVSYFVSGPDYPILPLYIYGLIRNGIKPQINALCSLVFISSLVTISMAYLLIQRDRSK